MALQWTRVSACDADENCNPTITQFRQECKRRGLDLASILSAQENKEACLACQAGGTSGKRYNLCWIGAEEADDSLEGKHNFHVRKNAHKKKVLVVHHMPHAARYTPASCAYLCVFMCALLAEAVSTVHALSHTTMTQVTGTIALGVVT